MKRSAILRLDNEKFSRSTLTQLEAEDKKPVGTSTVKEVEESYGEAPPVAKRSKTDSKPHKINEDMKSADRFFFNQYFPIKEAFLSDKFLTTHVDSEEKRQQLRDLSRKKCHLMGIVGRRAFHIFDKTHRTWICSTKKLGYQKLAKISQDKDSDGEELTKKKS